MVLLRLRALIFIAVFYVNTALFMVIGSPLLFGRRSWAMAGLAAHARVTMWWMRLICGTRVEVRGRN